VAAEEPDHPALDRQLRRLHRRLVERTLELLHEVERLLAAAGRSAGRRPPPPDMVITRVSGDGLL